MLASELQTASGPSLTESSVKQNDLVLLLNDARPLEKQDFGRAAREEDTSKQPIAQDLPVVSKEILTGHKSSDSTLPRLAAASTLRKPKSDISDKREEAGLSNAHHQHEEKAASPLPRSPLVLLPIEERPSTPTSDLSLTVSAVAPISSSLTPSSLTSLNSTTSINKPIQRKKRHPKAITSSTPRIRMTRAAALRQQKLVKQRASSIQPVSPSKPMANTSTHPGRPSLARATSCPPEDSPNRPALSSKTQLRQDSATKGKCLEEDSQRSHKPFVITKPSSLSPEKRTSLSGFGLFSTSSFFPPSVKDPASRARTATTLSNLNSALEKLALPPPSKPCSSSDEGERPRPSTSMGFTRDFDEQLKLGNRPGTVSRPASRAGSVIPGKKSMFPPPPPLFPGTSKDKGKGKASLPLKHFPFAKSAATERVGRTSIFGSGFSSGTFARPPARMKASQKTTLETVQGSPVKPSSSNAVDEDVPMPPSNLFDTEDSSTTNLNEGRDNTLPFDNSFAPTNGNSSDSGNLSADGKELKKITRLNASRRASMAFSALTQSLTAPQTEDESVGGSEQSPASESSTSTRKRTVNAVFTVPSSRPVRSAAPRSFTTTITPSGLARTQSEPTIPGPSTAPAAFGESDGEEGTRTGKKGTSNRSKMPGSLDVLNKCTIFVDVKTEDGEDAGALFVDMLRSLGAKVCLICHDSILHSKWVSLDFSSRRTNLHAHSL